MSNRLNTNRKETDWCGLALKNRTGSERRLFSAMKGAIFVAVIRIEAANS
jgi:hypothetical protein